jgi:hypothetical protein
MVCYASANSECGRLRLWWEERTFFFGRLETTPSLIKSRLPLAPSLQPSSRPLTQFHAVASPRLFICYLTSLHNDCPQRHQRHCAQQGTSYNSRESPALFLPLFRATPSSSPLSLLVRVIPTRSGMSPSHIPQPTVESENMFMTCYTLDHPHQNLNNMKRHDTNMSTAIRSPMLSSMPASRRTRSPRSPARLPPRPV